MTNKLFKKMAVGVVTLSSMGALVVPSAYSVVKADELDTSSVYQNNHHLSSNKAFATTIEEKHEQYDKYVDFDSDSQMFHIKDSAYQELATAEINIIQEKIDQTNYYASSVIKNNEMDKSLKVLTNNNGIEVVDLKKQVRGNGKNAIAFHWWGVRVWISKNTLNNIGTGLSLAGIWIPHPVAKAVVATFGVVLGRAPHGIVFNYTPGINWWGQSWQ